MGFWKSRMIQKSCQVTRQTPYSHFLLTVHNTNAYGGNWLHILLKMTGSFGCVVTSKQWVGCHDGVS